MSKIELINGSCADQKVDIVVNATNSGLWAGGGITISSDCDAEYQECFDKVSAMLDLLNTWYQPE